MISMRAAEARRRARFRNGAGTSRSQYREMPADAETIRTLEEEVGRYRSALDQLERIQINYSHLVEDLMSDLETEKSKSDALLRNVLPDAIIARLNAGETLIADKFADVAIVFSDLVGFTETSATEEPSAVVTALNDLFSRFDAACARLGVEKVKTIGDAYLAAAGLTGGGTNHLEAAAELALAMLDSLAATNAELGTGWRMRIGLDAGPVVAGIIGTHKYVYDVWGDTVNTASRLQTSSQPGRIHITRALADRLGPAYRFEREGAVPLKGKGVVTTCHLVGRAEGG